MRCVRLGPAVALLLTACSFRLPAAPDDGPIGGDDADAPMLPPDACVSFTDQFDACTTSVVGGDQPLTLDGDHSYNTDNNELRRGTTLIASPPHRVIPGLAGQDIDFLFVSAFRTLNGRLRVTGSRVFGIAALGPVEIDGELDLVSNGAGARSSVACGDAGGGNGDDDQGGAGGGGGGALGGAGGSGGPGDSDGEGPDTDGAAGGTAISLPRGPLGGCPGGSGGDGNGTAGGGGGGGGAIILASAASVTIGNSGVINAGGGGGARGGCNGCAGSGGGSGGMILLQAPSVVVDGVLAANGGSGGEGNSGNPGSSGRPLAQAAPGGSGGDIFGGNGGSGSAGTTLVGTTATDRQEGGGGGGGGGAGFIAIRSADPRTSDARVISPPFVPWPGPGADR